MIYLFLIAILLFAFTAPGLWVRHVMRKYHTPGHRFSFTGAEFARRLLDKLGLAGIKVEETGQGDHYDPDDLAVRLSPANYSSASLTAITVAAHEVGHAVQHADGYSAFFMRQKLVVFAVVFEKAAPFLMLAIPVLALIARNPLPAGWLFVIMLVGIALSTLVHLVTLPVELDASFARALPLLEREGILSENDKPAAKSILKAAAYTYVSGTLFGLLNFWRWMKWR